MRRNFLNDSANLRDAEGFVIGAVSGLMTTIAAGADVFGFQNLGPRTVVITGIRLRWVTTTAFGTAQALAFRTNKVTGFAAIHTTGGKSVQAHYAHAEGVSVNSAGVAVAVGDRIPLAEMSSYISNTGAISGATYTAEDTDEPEQFAVGAGSTLPGVYDDYIPTQGLLPLVCPTNTGIVVNNHILMGASGVGNLFVGLDLYRMP